MGFYHPSVQNEPKVSWFICIKKRIDRFINGISVLTVMKGLPCMLKCDMHLPSDLEIITLLDERIGQCIEIWKEWIFDTGAVRRNTKIGWRAMKINA